MVLEENVFVTSLSLQTHPLSTVKESIKTQYFDALTYFITHLSDNEPKSYTLRLKQYREFLLGKNASFPSNPEKSLRAIVDCRLQPWRKKYRHILLCDIALITQTESAVRTAANLMKERLHERHYFLLDKTVDALHVNDYTDYTSFPYIENLVKQYHINQAFVKKPERRIIVAANMSAGKSTLINALIGKRVARTSMEACTGNICYIYNKPYEDGRTHLSTTTTNLDASPEQLTAFDWSVTPSIATYFSAPQSGETRLCIIDTPGVNSALNKEHGNITKNALKNEVYDTLVYVIKGTDLGTDAELSYLKWISKNVAHDKIIFVLNRLDEFDDLEDDIQHSLDNVLADLTGLGFETPTVYPFSAYFAYLVQLVAGGEPLSKKNSRDYEYLKEKFMQDTYDLSKYYHEGGIHFDSDVTKDMRVRSGLSGIETIIWRGNHEKSIY